MAKCIYIDKIFVPVFINSINSCMIGKSAGTHHIKRYGCPLSPPGTLIRPAGTQRTAAGTPYRLVPAHFYH